MTLSKQLAIEDLKQLYGYDFYKAKLIVEKYMSIDKFSQLQELLSIKRALYLKSLGGDSSESCI